MNFELIASKTRYLKENPKGVREMCKAMEDLRSESFAEGREEQAKATALKLIKKGYSIDDIADIIEFDVNTIREWLTDAAV